MFFLFKVKNQKRYFGLRPQYDKERQIYRNFGTPLQVGVSPSATE